MKKILFFVLHLFVFSQVEAQIKFGLRGGISTFDVKADQLLVKDKNAINQLGIAVNDAKYGFHFGVVTQVRLGGFFVQPEVVFNSNSVSFAIRDFTKTTVVDAIKKESYQYVDIPMMLGFRSGMLRFQGGPVGHIFVKSTSELFDMSA